MDTKGGECGGGGGGGMNWEIGENGFSFSPLGTMLAVGLSYMAFIMLR